MVTVAIRLWQFVTCRNVRRMKFTAPSPKNLAVPNNYGAARRTAPRTGCAEQGYFVSFAGAVLGTKASLSTSQLYFFRSTFSFFAAAEHSFSM